jgi:hypothetical protein
MFTQGYIGVSNNVKKRWKDHKNKPSNEHLKHAINKYGWDSLIKKIILIAEDAYCLAMETKLRSNEKIGWNVAAGGGKPPVNKYNLNKHLSQETKDKISKSKKGFKHTPEIEKLVTKNLLVHGFATRFKKGEARAINEIEYTCPHCGTKGKIVTMNRWHLDKCKNKGVI